MIFERKTEKEGIQENSRGKSSEVHEAVQRTPFGPDTETDPAAGDQKPESIYQGHDGKEKKMQEQKLVELLEDLMSTVCDNCRKITNKTQEAEEEICADCPAGDKICAILNENNRYPQIILCEECEGYVQVTHQGKTTGWCRRAKGLIGYLDQNDGCSKGKKKGCN